MSNLVLTKREKKKNRIRKKISGTSDRPRISVYRSLIHIYAQLIDDVNHKTLASASTLSKEILEEIKSVKGKVAKSKLVGKLLAQNANKVGVKSVVFDRSGYDFHGRIKGIADGVREGGIKF